VEQDCCVDNRTTALKADNSRRDDALSATTWGAGLLWGGLVWLLDRAGVLAASGVPLSPTALFFLGFGIIVAIAIAVTLMVPGFKHADFFAYVLAGVAISVGLGTWMYTWPAVLVALGVVLVAGSVRRLRNAG